MPAILNNSEDEIILQVFQKLPSAFREIIVLSDVEEFSPDEIAAILQIPIETVTSRLLHGRKLMLHEIKGYEANSTLPPPIKAKLGLGNMSEIVIFI